GTARSIREQASRLASHVDDESLKSAAAALKEKMDAIESALIQPDWSSPLMKPSGLIEKLVTLPGMIATSDTRPAKQYYEVFEKLSREIDAEIARLQDAIEDDVKAFNAAL